MEFESFQIRGRGRGKKIGVPTINLQIPPAFLLGEGIYAVWVRIDGKPFKGALHFGPVPVFGDIRRSLEVYLIDSKIIPELEGKQIFVSIVGRIREIRNFPTPSAMVERIKEDVIQVRKVLKKAPKTGA